MNRRHFLIGGGLAAALYLAWRYPGGKLLTEAQAQEHFPVTHTEAEWRKLLLPAQYRVLRESATEPPFSSPLDQEHRAGTFWCQGCKQDLYSSDAKFDSHTGWPSFWKPLDRAVATTRDTSFGMTRDAVHCTRCGGHLGHVFDDGPKPTGLRYCMNGLAMGFTPRKA